MTTTLSILIADDKSDVVDAVSTELDLLAKEYKRSIKIYKAYSGTQVLKLSDEEVIDVFWLDYHFEYGMSGDEIIENIQDVFAAKKFVLMSGWEEKELKTVINKAHARLNGRWEFIRKPYDSLTLRSMFLNLLNFHDNRPHPLPIQYVYGAIKTSSSGLNKALAIKDFFETVIKYSIFLLMSDLGYQKKVEKLRLNLKPQMSMTFGAWLSWLVGVLDFFKNESIMPTFPELIDFYENADREIIKLMTEYKNVRDEKIGHGYVKADDWYSNVVSEYWLHCTSIYKNLHFLSRYIIIAPQKADFLLGDDFKYQVSILMGSDILHESKELTTQLRLINTQLYIYISDNKILPLSPFATYRVCAECSSRQLYFLDRIDNKQVTYNAFCNHRIEDIEAKKLFDKQYGSIFSNGKSG